MADLDLKVNYTGPTEDERKFVEGNTLYAEEMAKIETALKSAADAQKVAEQFAQQTTALGGKVDKNQASGKNKFWKSDGSGTLTFASPDDSLSVEGAIADAAAVGQALNNRMTGLHYDPATSKIYPQYPTGNGNEGITIVANPENYYTKTETDALFESFDVSEELEGYTELDSLPITAGQFIYTTTDNEGNVSVSTQAAAVVYGTIPDQPVDNTDYYVGSSGKYTHYRKFPEGLIAVGATEAGKYYRATFGAETDEDGNVKERVYSLYEISGDPEKINNQLSEDTDQWAASPDDKLVSRFQILSDTIQSVVTLEATTPTQLAFTAMDRLLEPEKYEKVYLGFNYASEDTDKQTYGATYRLTLNGIGIESGVLADTGTSSNPLNKTIDVTNRLEEGVMHNFVLTVTDNIGTRKILKWSINYINFQLSTTFSDGENRGANEVVRYPVKVSGANLSKNISVHYNEQVYTSVVADAEKEVPFQLPAAPHGRYIIQTEAAATTVSEGKQKTIYAPTLRQDLIRIDGSVKTPILGCSWRTDEKNVYTVVKDQYSSIEVPYFVYNGGKTETDLTIQVKIDGSLARQEKIVVTEGAGTWPMKLSENGEYEISLFINQGSETTERVIVKIDVTPITIKAIQKLKEANIDSYKIISFEPSNRETFSSIENTKRLKIGNMLLNGDTASNRQDYDIYLTTSSDFDWLNGGYQLDEEGDSYFLIKAGDSATINYKMFNKVYDMSRGVLSSLDLEDSGLTFQLIYKIKNVTSQEAFLTAYSETEHKGIQMFPHDIYLKTNKEDSDLRLPMSEDDLIDFGFTISSNTPKTEGIPMIMGYEDGVSTKPLVDEAGIAANIQQADATAQNIRIGSNTCDVAIYGLKIFATEFSAEDMLNSFIANSKNGSEMVARDNRNDFSAFGDLEKFGFTEAQEKLRALSQSLPGVSVILIEAPQFTQGKDKDLENHQIANTNVYHWYNPTQEEKTSNKIPPNPNWYASGEKCYHIGQGTSSNNYAAAGRNIDLNLKEASIVSLDNDQISLSDGVYLSHNSIPKKYLNIKVNIASSENANNALLQKMYNDGNPYKRPVCRYKSDGVTRDTELEEKVRDTMEFHNCVIFIRETGNNKIEFQDSDVHFYALGNIGDSKKTDDTRLTDPANPFECIVEIMDYSRVLSEFPLLKESITDTKQTIDTSDDEVKLASDWLNLDDFSEKYTYGWRYINNKGKTKISTLSAEHQAYAAGVLGYDLTKTDEAAELGEKTVLDVCKKNWLNAYKAVTATKKNIKSITNSEGKYQVVYEDNSTESYDDLISLRANTAPSNWKTTFESHFVPESAIYYTIFTERYTMVDNRAKNSFWHFGKSDASGTRKWDLCFDYDNDTALGIDNAGLLSFGYGYNDQDLADGTDTAVFRCRESTFFCRMAKFYSDISRENFEEDSKSYSSVYKAVNSKGNESIWVDKNLINLFDTWQNQWPERLWKMDIKKKYLDSYFKDPPTGVSQVSKEFLTKMANGRKKYQRRQFERNQYQYMGVKYRDSNMPSIFFRSDGSNKLESGAKSTLSLSIFDKAYIGYGDNANTISNCSLLRYPQDWDAASHGLNSDEEKVFKINVSGDMYEIWGAPWVKSCEGIGDTKIATANFSKAKRLQSLNLLPTEATEAHIQALSFMEGSPITNLNLQKTAHLTNIGVTKESSETKPVGGLKSFYSLEKVTVGDSALTSFEFADGGKLKEFNVIGSDLNKETNTTSEVSLVLNNLNYLEKFDYNKIKNLHKLTIKNGAVIDEKTGDATSELPSLKEILMYFYDKDKAWFADNTKSRGSKITEINIEGINWGKPAVSGGNGEGLTNKPKNWPVNGVDASTDYGLLDYLYKLAGTEILTSKVNLSGYIYFDYINSLQEKRYKQRWPGLRIEAGQKQVVYEVTIKDWDGTVLAYYEAPDNTTVTLPTGLTRASTKKYDYTFAKWDKLDAGATTYLAKDDIVLTAEYSETERKYTINWLDDEGNPLKDNSNQPYTSQVVYGEGATYPGPIPTKISKDNRSFLFDGWNNYPYCPEPESNGSGGYKNTINISAHFAEATPSSLANAVKTDLSTCTPQYLNANCIRGRETDQYGLEQALFDFGDTIDITLGWDPENEQTLSGFPASRTPVFDLMRDGCTAYYQDGTKETTTFNKPISFNYDSSKDKSVSYIDTGVSLFDRDEFTIVLDYQFNGKVLNRWSNGENGVTNPTSTLLTCTLSDGQHNSLSVLQNVKEEYVVTADDSVANAKIINAKIAPASSTAGAKYKNEDGDLEALSAEQILPHWRTSHYDRLVIRKQRGANVLDVFCSNCHLFKQEKETTSSGDLVFTQTIAGDLGNGVTHYTIPFDPNGGHNAPVILGCGGYKIFEGFPRVTKETLCNCTIDTFKVWNTAFSDIEAVKTANYPKETLTFKLTQFPRFSKNQGGSDWYKTGSDYPGIMLETTHYLRNRRRPEGTLLGADGKNYTTPLARQGWPNTGVCKWLNSRIYEAFPQAWQSAIKLVNVKYIKEKTAEVIDPITGTITMPWKGQLATTASYLFVPAVREYTEKGDYPTTDEGNLYQSESSQRVYGTTGLVPDNEERLKLFRFGEQWFDAFNRTRSPYVGSTGYHRVETNGGLGNGTSPNYKAHVDFAFCI